MPRVASAALLDSQALVDQIPENLASRNAIYAPLPEHLVCEVVLSQHGERNLMRGRG